MTHPVQQPDPPAIYEIRLKGYLSSDWSPWFDDMVITHDDENNTLLTGPVVDQAALHGLLDKVRDLGIPLLGVRNLPPKKV
ncbi:MAG: hypothetical protein AB1801_04275 [Chloroflexota bacterium]